MPDKPLILLGSARRDLRPFQNSRAAWRAFSYGACNKASTDDWKPMPTVGPGVREIRIRVEGAHRVFYVATLPDAIYVLHAFEKKSQKTTQRDLEIGRERFRAIGKLRQEHGKAKCR